MKVISTERIPIKMWLTEIEEGALEQAKHLANLPFVHKHIALMPDCHQGYGMPIGGVIAVKNAVIPSAVGVDIGCGMGAVKTTLQELSVSSLKEIMGEIRRDIPVGFKHHAEIPDVTTKYIDYMTINKPNSTFLPIVTQEYQRSLYQIGTLGGGNHFIEIQKGSDGFIWIMVHSGSRNLGKQVADHYNKIAVELNEEWFTQVPKEWRLAFLPNTTDFYRNYMFEMSYCVKFAEFNRRAMLEKICYIFGKHHKDIVFDDAINIAHNYAEMENHFGENVLVHRKGATLARKDTVGIIPGSQGTKSYIVKGKGNPESFMSCSHGAGRVMSRTKARAELSLEGEQKKLDDLGIVHSIRNASDLDEAPSAYKNIDEVMSNQEDLVEILVELTPLGVIKG